MISGTITCHYSKSLNSTLDEPIVIEFWGGQIVATSSDTEVRAVALRGRDDGAEIEWSAPGEPAYALRTGGGGSSKPMVCVAVHENQRGELTTSETMGTLNTGGGKPGQGYPYTAFDWQTAGSDRTRPNISEERTSAIQCTNLDAVMNEFGVRRLSPLECERLQGMPDDHTAKGVNDKGDVVKISDAQRYRQCGNSVAIPCVQFIADRIVLMDAMLRTCE